MIITQEAYRRVARRDMFPKGAKVGVNNWADGQHVVGWWDEGSRLQKAWPVTHKDAAAEQRRMDNIRNVYRENKKLKKRIKELEALVAAKNKREAKSILDHLQAIDQTAAELLRMEQIDAQIRDVAAESPFRNDPVSEDQRRCHTCKKSLTGGTVSQAVTPIESGGRVIEYKAEGPAIHEECGGQAYAPKSDV